MPFHYSLTSKTIKPKIVLYCMVSVVYTRIYRVSMRTRIYEGRAKNDVEKCYVGAEIGIETEM